MRTTGTWAGEYTYGADYPIAGRSVPFRMSLRETWLLRTFRGPVQDDASHGGFPEQGWVRGRRRGRTLEFIKFYPESYACGGDSLVSLRDILSQQTGMNEDLPPHRVHYIGRIDAGRASGTWQIMPWHIPQ